MYRRAVILSLLVVSSLPIATSRLQAQMSLRGTSTAGRRLFHSPSLSRNGLACSHCHADFDESRRGDGLIRAGHSLANSAARETWWGKDPSSDDAYPNVAAAALVCVEHYQRNPDKLTAQQMLDLQAYLTSLTTHPTRTPLAIAPAADPTGEYQGFDKGNPFSGKRLFYAACHSCHPNARAGIAPALPRSPKAPAIARKIREGDGLGAVLSGVDPNAYDATRGEFMPFFGADRLTDEQVADIIAYLSRVERDSGTP